MKAIVVLFVIIALMISLNGIVSGLPSSGSLYISLPNSSIKCANIILPDDGGYYGIGAYEYEITMSPDSYQTWSDLTGQVVVAGENNTVKIPVCFRSFGKPFHA